MGIIVAIGGGECGRPGTTYETEEIDLEIVSLTKKKNPNFLLIALGNDNPEMYFNILGNIYRDRFGCYIDQIIKSELEDYELIKNKIEWADIIYVGGGNSLRLIKLFRKYHIDKLLENAYKEYKVLCGLSAGAICWCDFGNSNSRVSNIGKKKLIRVKALGFLKILLCPHYNVDVNRAISLKKMMKRTYKVPALALDDCVAIEVIDDMFRIISSVENAKARKIYWRKGEYIQAELEKYTYINLKELYQM